MIQILTYSGKEKEYEGKDVVVNSLHEPQSLDEFQINIINLQSNEIWCNEGNINSINVIDDFKSLSTMIDNSEETKVVVLLPQNIKFHYHQISDNEYLENCEIKNMIYEFKNNILNQLAGQVEALDIAYENTNTNVVGHNMSAAFYFNGVNDNILTESVKSKKATTIEFVDIWFSTLLINTYDDIIAFLTGIKFLQEKEDVPGWIEEVQMFDDVKQLGIIHENECLISQHEKEIEIAREALVKNQKYKSILYTNGDELVEVVFEILENILGCDLSGFQDCKKEDFNFSFNGKTYIGEIKGVTPNVKKANVSQLDVHVQEYLDEHEEVQRDKVVSLLVINHQRNKPLNERECIPDDQIRLAERNGSLIIETSTLLKLFEKYLSGEKKREECVNIFVGNTGLLNV